MSWVINCLLLILLRSFSKHLCWCTLLLGKTILLLLLVFTTSRSWALISKEVATTAWSKTILELLTRIYRVSSIYWPNMTMWRVWILLRSWSWSIIWLWGHHSIWTNRTLLLLTTSNSMVNLQRIVLWIFTISPRFTYSHTWVLLFM